MGIIKEWRIKNLKEALSDLQKAYDKQTKELHRAIKERNQWEQAAVAYSKAYDRMIKR